MGSEKFFLIIFSGETTKEKLKGRSNDFGPQFKEYSPSFWGCEPPMLIPRQILRETDVVLLQTEMKNNRNLIP